MDPAFVDEEPFWDPEPTAPAPLTPFSVLGHLSSAGASGVQLIGANVHPGFRLAQSNLTRCNVASHSEGDIRNCFLIECDLPPWLMPGAVGVTDLGGGRFHDNRCGNFIEASR